MKHLAFTDKVQKLLAQRNFSFVVILFLMGVNILALVGLTTKNEKIIVIPSLNTDSKHYIFEGSSLSDEYLIDWADTLLGAVLTVNPETVDRKNKEFLKWAISSTALYHSLEANAKRIKKDHLSTVFYPKEYKVDQDSKVVLVSGDFYTYLGHDKNPILEHKTFRVGYLIRPSGFLAVNQFQENPHD